MTGAPFQLRSPWAAQRLRSTQSLAATGWPAAHCANPDKGQHRDEYASLGVVWYPTPPRPNARPPKRHPPIWGRLLYNVTRSKWHPCEVGLTPSPHLRMSFVLAKQFSLMSGEFYATKKAIWLTQLSRGRFTTSCTKPNRLF